MNSKLCLIIYFILFPIYNSLAQYQISGIVKNEKYEPLPDVNIFVKGKVLSSTDTLGFFRFNYDRSLGNVLYFKAVNFKTDSLILNFEGLKMEYNIILKTELNQLNTVEIKQIRSFNLPDINVSKNYMTVALTPGAAADVVAAMQSLPGAAPISNETGFFVRGGASNESAVMFDGMLVKNPYGSKLPDLANRSRFSPFLFNQTSFTTSGYSAAYGNALSSVMNLETRTLANDSSTEFAFINLGLGAAHTQRFKSSSLTVGLNYYNFNPYHKIINQLTPWVKDPEQLHGSINYKYKTSNTGILKIFIDYSDTDLSFNILNPNSNNFELLKNRNKNIYTNINFNEYLGKHWKLFAGLAINKTQEKGTYNGNDYFQNDDLWQEKVTFSRVFNNKISLLLGTEFFQNQRKEGLGTLNRGYTDNFMAFFTEADLDISSKLKLFTGLRGEYSSYMNKHNISPRIGLAFKPLKDHEFKINYGVYFQKPEDSFLATSNLLNFEKNQQWALDYEIKKSSKVYKISTFLKDYKDLITIETPLFSGFQAYGPPLVINAVHNNGYGKAKGFDLFFKDSSSIKFAEYSMNYSFVDSKRKFLDYPISAQPNFAPRHTFNLNYIQFNKKLNWNIATLYTFSSGRSYFNPLNNNFLNDKTKSYHNLSVSISHIPSWLKGFGTFNLNVNNVLGFNNVFGYRYAYNGLNRVGIYPPAKRSILLSFLWNLKGQDFNR